MVTPNEAVTEQITKISPSDIPLIRMELSRLKQLTGGETDNELIRLYAELRVERERAEATRLENEKQERIRLQMKDFREQLRRGGVDPSRLSDAEVLPRLEEMNRANAARDEARRTEQGVRARRRYAEDLFRKSQCPPRHAINLDHVDSETPSPWLTTLTILDTQALYANGFIVALLGKRGCGKTQMAIALIHRCCQRGMSCRYIKAGDLFRSIRTAFNQPVRGERGVTELEMFNQFVGYDLLIIDETHERSESTFESSTLTNIVDRRYDGRRCTILISNEDKIAFAAAIGSSIASRIHECGEAIECDWPSFRRPGNWRQTEGAELRKVSTQFAQEREDN